jgi:uncharacterized membrane protein
MGRNRIQNGVTASAIAGVFWMDHDAHAMKLAGNQLPEDSSEVSRQLLRANWLIQYAYRINQALQIAVG